MFALYCIDIVYVLIVHKTAPSLRDVADLVLFGGFWYILKHPGNRESG